MRVSSLSKGGPHASLPTCVRTASRRSPWCAAVVCLLAALGVNRADEPIQAKTAPALHQQLSEVVDNITWEKRGLRSGLERLSEVYGIAIFLDRRVDPSMPISAAARNQTLESFLKQIAAEAHAGVASWLAFYNAVRPHHALANRTPMEVWHEGMAASLAADITPRLDNAAALPTCPQPQQQQQTALFAS